ncbi:MAG: hypothetical protein IPM54_14945 [Polyangiaceae bacterium]|nr:hypothetical protein [Polyangiaceae bacterium]
MPGRNVSRRLFVGVMGSGVIATPVVASIPIAPANAADHEAAELAMRSSISRLLHPLAPGARFANWTVAQIDPLVGGAVSVKIRSDEQHTFDLEIMARDTSALAQKPPAETAKFAVFVVNGGDGWAPTREEQGLAAMTLAKILAKNERDVDLPGLLTHAERLRRHADALLIPAPGSAG